MDWFGSLLDPNAGRRTRSQRSGVHAGVTGPTGRPSVRARRSSTGQRPADMGGRRASKSVETVDRSMGNVLDDLDDHASPHAIPTRPARASTGNIWDIHAHDAATAAWGAHDMSHHSSSLSAASPARRPVDRFAEPTPPAEPRGGPAATPTPAPTGDLPSYAAATTPGTSVPRTKQGSKIRIRTRNILVLGGNHTGKSSFVNTYRRGVTGGDDWATAPAGRVGARGTERYEPCFVPGEGWVLVDTPGRRMNKPLRQCPDEEVLYTAMLRGLEWKTDITVDAWQALCDVACPSSVDVVSPVPSTPSNAVDHVVFVISATDIVRDRGLSSMLGGIGARFAASVAKVRELESRFAWWERHLGNAPFVVVTHLDAVAPWGLQGLVEQKIREALDKIVHKNRVFCVSNPDEPECISHSTASTIELLHRKIMSDIDTRTSSVLQGRNALWGENGEERVQRTPNPDSRVLSFRSASSSTAAEGVAVEDIHGTLDGDASQASSVAAGDTAARRKSPFPDASGGAQLWSVPVAVEPASAYED